MFLWQCMGFEVPRIRVQKASGFGDIWGIWARVEDESMCNPVQPQPAGYANP